jgi:hypothetical protein
MFVPSSRRPSAEVVAATIVSLSLVVALVLSLTLRRDTGAAAQALGALRSEACARPVAPPLAAAATEGRPVRLVQLDVRVQPSHAVLSIDGQRLSSNPLAATMVWDSQWHTLRGEAPGFQPFVASFRLDSDVKMRLASRARMTSSRPPSMPAAARPTRCASACSRCGAPRGRRWTSS